MRAVTMVWRDPDYGDEITHWHDDAPLTIYVDIGADYQAGKYVPREQWEEWKREAIETLDNAGVPMGHPARREIAERFDEAMADCADD